LRLLQLETLYDLALALGGGNRPEEDLVDELLGRVCAVLNPGAALAFTRDRWGAVRSVASVGWRNEPPGSVLGGEALWGEVAAASGSTVARTGGVVAGRAFRELAAVAIAWRGSTLGYLALLDKERRGDPEGGRFSESDQRWLESVAALAGAMLDSAREREFLATQRDRLEEENRALRRRLVGDGVVVASAPAMRRALDTAERVAPRGVTVLLRGESGTGKELVARFLHERSGRQGALVAINCAAIPESLLESELFGIEGGVATGVQARRGKFELADGGTLLLDEIGDLDLPLQVKLLRALQEREVVRVGGQSPVRVDVRVIAATHQPLEDLVDRGQFREDLYYRLRGVEIELPPLRDRREDIVPLLRHFAVAFCRREALPEPVFEPDAIAVLLAYDFPGNVRELQNLVEASISLADERVDAALLGPMLGSGSAGAEPLTLETIEERHIRRVLRMTEGNKSAAARVLGIDRRTLARKGF
jgi:transcriptional regulator with PAS, ATPase and Fis domain